MTTTLCQMEEIEGRPGFQWCPVCQRQRFWPQEQKSPKALPANYRRECPGKPVESLPSKLAVAAPTLTKPDFKQRVKNYRNALGRQAAAGNPIRTDQEKAILYALCQECPSGKFISKPVLPLLTGGGECGACGCGLSMVRNLFNATAFATYKCKLGHWDDLIAAGKVSYCHIVGDSTSS